MSVCLVFPLIPEKSLTEYDAVMASLCQWCDQHNERAVLLPRVGELISVRGAEPGDWLRAKVSRQVSEW